MPYAARSDPKRQFDGSLPDPIGTLEPWQLHRLNRCQLVREQPRDTKGTEKADQKRYLAGQNGDNAKEKGPILKIGPLANYLILVPEIGIEPTTYALRMRRSTN